MFGIRVHPNGWFLRRCLVHNYEHPFEVVGEPYDYGLPGSVYVKFEDKKSKSH